MDAIALLEKDHQKVTELFRRFNGGGGLTGIVKRMTGNVPNRQRRQTADQVCRELDVHAQIEEEIFYPAVRSLNDDRLNGMLSEAFKEHATVKQQVAAIRNAVGMDSDLQAKMDELQACVDHHVREEEHEMFPRLQLLMDAPRRDELGHELQQRKRQATPAIPARRAMPKRAAAGRSTKTRTRATATRRSRSTASAKRARTRRLRTAAASKQRKRVRTAARGRAKSRRAR